MALVLRCSCSTASVLGTISLCWCCTIDDISAEVAASVLPQYHIPCQYGYLCTAIAPSRTQDRPVLRIVRAPPKSNGRNHVPGTKCTEIAL
eukprot:286340-Rhodomonas_salina.1